VYTVREKGAEERGTSSEPDPLNTVMEVTTGAGARWPNKCSAAAHL